MLSTVATVIQLAVVLAATSWPAFSVLKISLVGAGLAAIIYGALFTFGEYSPKGTHYRCAGRVKGDIHILQVRSALGTVGPAAALDAKFGRSGVIVAAAAAGFADTHSAAVSVASLVASGKLSAQESASNPCRADHEYCDQDGCCHQQWWQTLCLADHSGADSCGLGCVVRDDLLSLPLIADSFQRLKSNSARVAGPVPRQDGLQRLLMNPHNLQGEQRAWRTTASEAPPRRKRCVARGPEQSESAFHSEAASKMTLLGSPVVTDVVTLKPAEESVFAARSATSRACGSRSSSSG